MALIQTVNSSDLYNMACKMGRGDNFGYNGWKAIGEHLEEPSDDTGEDVEVDIISLCCDYSMAESVDDAYSELQCSDLPDDEEWEDMGEDEKLSAVKSYLQRNTVVVCCDDDLIIWQAF